MNTKQAEAYILFTLLDINVSSYEYVAVDEGGSIYGYHSKPFVINGNMWNTDDVDELAPIFIHKMPPFDEWNKVLIKIS